MPQPPWLQLLVTPLLFQPSHQTRNLSSRYRGPTPSLSGPAAKASQVPQPYWPLFVPGYTIWPPTLKPAAPVFILAPANPPPLPPTPAPELSPATEWQVSTAKPAIVAFSCSFAALQPSVYAVSNCDARPLPSRHLELALANRDWVRAEAARKWLPILRVYAQTIYYQDSLAFWLKLCTFAHFIGFLPLPWFLVPWFSSLTAKSDLADFVFYVWRRRWGGGGFVCLFVCKNYISLICLNVFCAKILIRLEQKFIFLFGSYFRCKQLQVFWLDFYAKKRTVHVQCIQPLVAAAGLAVRTHSPLADNEEPAAFGSLSTCMSIFGIY
jgi:hypothetical protein